MGAATLFLLIGKLGGEAIIASGGRVPLGAVYVAGVVAGVVHVDGVVESETHVDGIVSGTVLE